MDSTDNKILQEFIHFYHTKCADDAKILREAVEKGEAISMYFTLSKNWKLSSESFSEKLLHGARFFYFLGYCLKYNDGIPIIEILNHSIDNGKKDKVINAVKSQKTILDFLISKGVDKVKLEEYVAEREIIEYAIDENKKSTGVLKRLLAISKQVSEKEAKQTDSFETKNGLTESEKYEQSIRVTKIATEEDIERFSQWQGNALKVGDEYSIIPEPINKEELFERFEKLNAQCYFETLQGIYIQKYGEGNKKIIKDELSALNSFIEKSNELSTTETFKNKWVDPKEADLYEYSRLANNYYKNPKLPFSPISYFNNNAVQVYARYFLYKNWLEDKLNMFNKVLSPQTSEAKNQRNITNIEKTHSEIESSENLLYNDLKDRIKYTYSDLIEILNGMYDEKQILNQDTIKWGDLEKGVTNSIIDELYHLQNDSQRNGFLNITFKRFFCDGKDYNLSLIESKGITGFENEQDFQYIKNCLLVLNGIILEVSDQCIQYKGVDFSKIIKENIRTAGIKPNFIWYSREQIESPQQHEVETIKETELENDFTLSTIEDWLFPFKEEGVLINTDYNNLITALKQYFDNGKFPTLNNQIRVKKVNIKRFGWALNEIFRANTSKNETLPIDYLKFAKENISIFRDVTFEESDYLKSNLYKYFTTKTQ